MNFIDGSLFPENQEKLVITVAPYGPEWTPADFPEAESRCPKIYVNAKTCRGNEKR